MRISKREMAYKLFAQGKGAKEVSQETGLKESTCKFYQSRFNCEQKESKNNKIENNVAQAQEDVVIGVHTDAIQIGSDIYDLTFYLDTVDGSMWFDFFKIMEALSKEKLINPKTFKTKIPDRYFRNEKINEESKHLIDKIALVELAKEVDDYTFTTSVLELTVGEVDNVFYKFNQIITSFQLMESVINNLDRKYEEMEAYNNAQFDLLHEYDNEAFLTDAQLLEKAKKMQAIRINRRSVRNEVVLAKTLRKLLRENGMGVGSIGFTKNKLSRLLDDLYSKKYNPRLEDWQKDIVETESLERLTE